MPHKYSKIYYQKNKKAIESQHKQYVSAVRKYLNLIKESKKCEICGEGRATCLDFHHKNRRDKELTIASVGTRSIAKIQKEISKCMVVCANCHRIIHATEQLKQVEQAIKDKKLPLFDS